MTEAKEHLIRVISPPSRLQCADFAEAEIYLPAEGNAEPGKYHTSRMPWQIDMLQDVHDSTVDEHIWMLGSQLGKTLTLILILIFFVAKRPRKILVVYPKLDDARDWMRDKFIPTCDDTPAVAGLIKSPREHKSRSRDLNRKFPGGGIVAVGSISTSSLRRLSAAVVIQDEIDDFETTKQGDSMELADMRAATFANAFKLKSSTPTNIGESRSQQKFEASDQQHYFIPCKCCGGFFAIELKHLKFSFSREEILRFDLPDFNPNNFTWDQSEKSRDVRCAEKTILVCEHCSRGLSDVDRIAAIRSRHPDNPPVVFNGKNLRAEWRATAPKTKIKGRRLPAFYRLIGKPASYANYLHWFAEIFLNAKRGGIEKMRVWTNTFEARAFETPSEKLDWNPIRQRAEDYNSEMLPEGVCLLVAGVDIQMDRVEIIIYGFGEGEEAWAISYDVVWGDFDQSECQSRVNEVLSKKFSHPVLGDMFVVAAGIDTGHQTRVKAVYRFCRTHAARKFWAMKGSSHAMGSVYSFSENKIFRIKIFSVNTDFLKTTIYDRLKNEEPGPSYIHFPRGGKFDEKFYKMLCSERRKSRKAGGETIYYWEKITARNEALDVTVYAFAAFDILKPQGFIARQWKIVLDKLRAKNDELYPKQELRPPSMTLTNESKPAPAKIASEKPSRRPGWFKGGRQSGFVGGWKR